MAKPAELISRAAVQHLQAVPWQYVVSRAGGGMQGILDILAALVLLVTRAEHQHLSHILRQTCEEVSCGQPAATVITLSLRAGLNKWHQLPIADCILNAQHQLLST